jgi:hypothetical protein
MATQNEAMRGVFQLLALQRDVAADVAAQRTRLEQEEGQGDMAQVLKLLESAPQLVQTLAPIVMAMSKKQPKLPKASQANGVAPKPETPS